MYVYVFTMYVIRPRSRRNLKIGHFTISFTGNSKKKKEETQLRCFTATVSTFPTLYPYYPRSQILFQILLKKKAPFEITYWASAYLATNYLFGERSLIGYSVNWFWKIELGYRLLAPFVIHAQEIVSTTSPWFILKRRNHEVACCSFGDHSSTHCIQ